MNKTPYAYVEGGAIAHGHPIGVTGADQEEGSPQDLLQWSPTWESRDEDRRR